MILTKEMVEGTTRGIFKIKEGFTEIGNRAFACCINLKEVVIPEGVTKIDIAAFKGCESLEKIVIPEGVTTIGMDAFEGCKSLEKIVIPEGVTAIHASAFESCETLKSVVIPEGVTTIGMHTFEGCKSLEKIVIPEGVTSLGDYCFAGCINLKEVVIPEGVKIIYDSVFKDCKSLKKIVIPSSVTTIGHKCFSGCEALETIVVPSEITTMKEETFDCQATIYYQGSEYIYIENPDLRPMSEGLLINIGKKNWVRLNTQLLELGIHPFHEKKWVEPTEEDVNLLGEAFKTKFHRTPKVIDQIALAQAIWELDTEEIIKIFSIEGFKEALKMSDNCPFVAIIALLGAGGDLLHKFPIETSFELGLATVNVRNWIRKHPDSFKLLPRLKGMEHDIDENMSVSEVKKLIVEERALNDLKKIQRKYNFTLADCKCKIEQTEVKLEHLTAHLLKSSEVRQITVGYDTYCCQHYGGAGETAMMYGILSDTAGFWVIEDNNEIIKAQAEVWLTKDKSTFVFDNIEFANDRDVSDFESIIKKWVAATPYPNVVLGMGYTEINLGCPTCKQPIQPHVEGLNYVYTDTHRCVCLKKDGELTW